MSGPVVRRILFFLTFGVQVLLSEEVAVTLRLRNKLPFNVDVYWDGHNGMVHQGQLISEEDMAEDAKPFEITAYSDQNFIVVPEGEPASRELHRLEVTEKTEQEYSLTASGFHLVEDPGVIDRRRLAGGRAARAGGPPVVQDPDAAYRLELDWQPQWQPNTPAWKNYMDYRASQVARISKKQARYDGYMAVVTQGYLVRNFTERGWALVDAPRQLFEDLRNALHKGLPTARKESIIEQIRCDSAARECNRPEDWPLFVDTGMGARVLQELQPLHEAWSGVKLKPSIAYGLRVYQNGSSLTMHIDKMDTHIISSIFHIDHDSAEPWPIVIEGFDGKTAEVDLKPGQILHYESAKCTHGRPRSFNGKWYSSMFVHYRPVDWAPRHRQAVESVPENWGHMVPDDGDFPRLDVYGTGFREPECSNGWCTLDPSFGADRRMEL